MLQMRRERFQLNTREDSFEELRKYYTVKTKLTSLGAHAGAAAAKFEWGGGGAENSNTTSL